MPKAVHDLAIKLQSQGKSEDSAWAIANSQLGKTTKNDKNMEELMDQSPSMTNLKPSPQNTAGWPTSMNPGFGNKMSQMRENGMPCDICGGPEHPPMDHPYLPRMPNDPMAMTQPQMPMPMPMPQPQMPMQPPMQTNPAQTQPPPSQNEGGMGSGRIPTGGGGAMQPSSGGGGGGGAGGGGGDGGFGHGMGGAAGGGMRPQPGPVVSFETDYVSDTPAQNRMNETIMKQILDKKVGCGCQKTLTNKKRV